MKKYSYIAGALAIVAMTGCAEFHETNDFVVEKPESIKTYEYLNDYAALNSYVDPQAHPNFQLGVGMNGSDYFSRSGLYALACSNFDMYIPYADMMYGTAVSNDGIISLDGVQKIADAARAGQMDVFGYAITSTTNHNGKYMRSILDNAVASLGEDQKIVDFEMHYGELEAFPYELINGFQPTIQDGVLFAKMSNKKHQVYLACNVPTSVNYNYDITIKLRGNKSATMTLHLGTADERIKVPITTSWAEQTITIAGVDDNFSIIIDPANTKIDLEVEYCTIKHQRSLTEDESLALYNEEMKRWISSLVNVTDGSITKWCLTNEPLASEAGEDGAYALKHAPDGSKTECYWQDVMGDIDFVKKAYDITKEAYADVETDASSLKFYVTEDCLGDEAKARNLLDWIGKWEAAGVKIDGVGVKMHLTCSLDAQAQADMQAQVNKTLEILAASGKEVLVTELDITLADANGKKVATASMTMAEQQILADCYKWLVKTYFDKVPAAQQAGIYQWTVKDTTNPMGLWSAELKRLPAYAGFADGLAGK